jgi:hypothetical protein
MIWNAGLSLDPAHFRFPMAEAALRPSPTFLARVFKKPWLHNTPDHELSLQLVASAMSC